MKKLLLIGTLLLITCIAFAQNNFQNTIYLETLGSAGPYSVNYERTFSSQTYLRGGISLFRGASLPIMYGKYFGKGNHHFEIAGGVTLSSWRQANTELQSGTKYRNQLILTAFAGYRYQKPEKRFLFRIGYSPVCGAYDSHGIVRNPYVFHWAGVSFGRRF